MAFTGSFAKDFSGEDPPIPPYRSVKGLLFGTFIISDFFVSGYSHACCIDLISSYIIHVYVLSSGRLYQGC